MARYFLTRVCVEGFRGINNEGEPLDLRFRPDAVNSVFAVNGTGKTSLFEALYYAIHDRVPKLSELQTAERPGDYYANRFHSQRAATISLEFTPDDGGAVVAVEVRRDRDGARKVTSPSGHPDPEAFLLELREDFALLDYGTFVKFINDSPLDRGRSFAALLGLSAYSKARQALQGVSETRVLNADLELKALTATIAEVSQASQQAFTSVRTTYETVMGREITDVSKLDEHELEVHRALGAVELLKDLFAGKEPGEIDFEAVKQVVRSAEGGEKRAELQKTVAAITKLQALADGDAAAVDAECDGLITLLRERDALLEQTGGELLKALLDSAESLLSGGGWDRDNDCPLCGTEGLSRPLGKTVADKLSRYTSVEEKTAEISTNWREASWIKRLYRLEQSPEMGVEDGDRKSTEFKRLADSGKLTVEAVEIAKAALAGLEKRRSELLASHTGCRQTLEGELPQSLVRLTEQIENARQFRDSLELHRRKSNEEQQARRKLALRERWKGFISKATKAFSDAEAALARKRITGIDALYKDMFLTIMNVRDVVPELQRADKSEALNVQLNRFHGQQGLSARALLSESYRNALAISVFLGSAMQHSGKPRFVVLDDVTSSFDSGHQWQLMELIRRELCPPSNPDGLQFIVLSHDGLLEKYFDRHGNTSDWHHQRLQGLPPMGAVMSQAQDANRLRGRAENLLQAGQIREAEPLIRQYLEFKLVEIIRKVGVPVPLDFAIRDHNRMVSNCTDAITAAVRLHQSASSLVLDDRQVADINGVHLPALVGNWVAHYETGAGASLSAPALLGVLQSIDDLAECFRYDHLSGGATTRRWYRSLSSK